MTARITIIDDDEDYAAFMVELLRRAGYEAISFRSAPQAVKYLRERGADLAIVDLFMPELDGIEVVRRLCEQVPHLPVIGITGGTSSMSNVCLNAMFKLGATQVFSKPVDNARLFAAIRDLIGARAEIA